MSLRMLFTLMGLVTALMIGGVVYTKILTKPEDRPITVAEMRGIDRVCDTHCGSQMRAMAEQTDGPEALEQAVRQCLGQCRDHLSRGRLQPREADKAAAESKPAVAPTGVLPPKTPAPPQNP